MDQAESSPSPGQPEPGQPAPGRPSRPGRPTPKRDRRPEREVPALRLEHPVVAGYDGSASSRNALAYAAGLSMRLGRPLLIVYVCSSADALERWLLAELDQVTGNAEVDVHVRTRRGSPARELAAAAEEYSADALVIGAPTHIWHRIAGSVSGWLARHARCPVIVVP